MIENTCIQCKKHFRSITKTFFCNACKAKYKDWAMGIMTFTTLASPFIAKGVKQVKKIKK